MTYKESWERKLQERFGANVRLPRDVAIEGEGSAPRVMLLATALGTNMQTDAAAFEPWCLALRLAGAERVTLGWNGSLSPGGQTNRFLHRVTHYRALFHAWFTVAAEQAPQVRDVLDPSLDDDGRARWVLNTESEPRQEQCGRFALDASEHELELAIVNQPALSRAFRGAFRLRHVARQLPVGVFDRVITTELAVFTHRKSAIDLWGLSRDSSRLALFELKNEENVKAGALSELFFYATLLRQVQKGLARFSATPDGDGPSYGDIPSTEGIDAFVLAPRAHPILAGDGLSVLATLNTALAAAGEPIRFGLGVIQRDGIFLPVMPAY